MLQPGDLVYKNAADVSNFMVHLDPPILLRFLGITNEMHPLTICELKLIENGKYTGTWFWHNSVETSAQINI